ncbi:MAG TPA: biotin-dependent carboxyltransferase family protein [Xanthomonadales bacterium]|nr:biotin-dependent carboxyltransferase family protein [Xanthomonadales bacterium]
MMLEILAPGPLTTVQDAGRSGLRHLGVSSAGAADADALAIANRLVGNAPGAAGLEMTLAGPTVQFRDGRFVALTGGECDAHCAGRPVPQWRPVWMPAGATLEIKRLRRGARAYLAVSGGLATPRVLGSRSTDVRGEFGGRHGRALRSGDRLKLFAPAPDTAPALWRRAAQSPREWFAAGWWVEPTEDLRGDSALLHVLPGRHADALDPKTLRMLRDETWTVAKDSDRMGLRFDGPLFQIGNLPEQVSAAVLPGSLQLPPDGRPILLGVDAQTVGGYPVIAHVIRSDLARAMQLRPGDRVRAVLVNDDGAAQAWKTRRLMLARMAEGISWRLRM